MNSFKDLDQKELYRSAIEDFAIDVPEDANEEELRAAFLETGVTWAMYLEQHPELVETVEVETKFVEREPESQRPGAVITADDVSVAAVQEVAPRVRVKEAPVLSPQDKYLVKMIRDNTIFETRGHRFTKEHPYALVGADDFRYILEEEDGFRQAMPSELEEFYS